MSLEGILAYCGALFACYFGGLTWGAVSRILKEFGNQA